MIDHIAIAANSESDSDLFFNQLLGLERIRVKNVPRDLMEKFFGLKKDYKFVLYGNVKINFEVFITNDASKTKDIFTHSCLYIENRDEFIKKAVSMGFVVKKVPRNDSNGYYLFIKDKFQNLYEIKEL